MRTAIAILISVLLAVHAGGTATGDAGPVDVTGLTGYGGDASGSDAFSATGEIGPPDVSGATGSAETLSGSSGGDAALTLTATGAPGNGSLSNSTDSTDIDHHHHHHHRRFWDQFAVDLAGVLLLLAAFAILVTAIACIAAFLVATYNEIVWFVVARNPTADYSGIRIADEGN